MTAGASFLSHAELPKGKIHIIHNHQQLLIADAIASQTAFHCAPATVHIGRRQKKHDLFIRDNSHCHASQKSKFSFKRQSLFLCKCFAHFISYVVPCLFVFLSRISKSYEETRHNMGYEEVKAF